MNRQSWEKEYSSKGDALYWLLIIMWGVLVYWTYTSFIWWKPLLLIALTVLLIRFRRRRRLHGVGLILTDTVAIIKRKDGKKIEVALKDLVFRVTTVNALNSVIKLAIYVEGRMFDKVLVHYNRSWRDDLISIGKALVARAYI